MQKRTIILMFALAMGIALLAGCGANMTVQNIVDNPNPEETPTLSDTSSAALLSGFGVTRGGDSYKIVQTLGGAIAKPVQQSEGGTYTIKLQAKESSSEDDL